MGRRQSIAKFRSTDMERYDLRFHCSRRRDFWLTGNTGTVLTKLGQLSFTTNSPGASRIRLSGRGAVAISRSRIGAKPVTRLPGGFDTNSHLMPRVHFAVDPHRPFKFGRDGKLVQFLTNGIVSERLQCLPAVEREVLLARQQGVFLALDVAPVAARKPASTLLWAWLTSALAKSVMANALPP